MYCLGLVYTGRGVMTWTTGESSLCSYPEFDPTCNLSGVFEHFSFVVRDPE